MTSIKPYKGEIHKWKRMYYPVFPGNRYAIVGEPHGHPEFVDYIRTSPVQIFQVDSDGQHTYVETLNSSYVLIGEERAEFHIKSFNKEEHCSPWVNV